MNPSTKARVWIITLNWRNSSDTVECLDSILEAADREIAGVVVCDNNSCDDSVDRLRLWAKTHQLHLPELSWKSNYFYVNAEITEVSPNVATPQLRLIHTGGNLGFAGGNNVGIEYVRQHCQFEFILLLNNDAQITSTAVSLMVSRLEEDHHIGMCGCTVIYHTPAYEVQALGGASFNKWLGRGRHIGAHTLTTAPRSRAAVEAQLDYILGAALMITRTCIDDVGPMTESYFLYCEEVDWAIRAQNAGYMLGYAPTAEIYHKEGRTIGSSTNSTQRSLLSEYYLFRSRISFTLKFYPCYLPTVFGFSVLQSLRPIFTGDFKRSKVRFKGLFHLPHKHEDFAITHGTGAYPESDSTQNTQQPRS